MRTPGPRSFPSRAQWLRRLALRRRDRVAFAFSGGGPLGALQVGALRALYEHGIYPEMAVGTSVGALNAAFTAFDPSDSGVDALEGIWRALRDHDLFPGGRFKTAWARFLTRGDHVFDNSGMRKLVTDRLGEDARFEDALIPLGVVATDLDTGAEELFTQGRILLPLLASTAMPGIYPPIEIDGRTLIDGGVANNVPIAPAVGMGARTIYVMDTTGQRHQRRPLNRPIDYLLHAFGLARSQRLTLEHPLLAERARLVMLPTPPLDFYVPFASMSYTDRLIATGYEHAYRFLSGEVEAVVKTVRSGEVEAIAPAE